jgi:hypothetical protein
MDSKKAVEDGSIWEQIESQPEPHEIVEQWRDDRRGYVREHWPDSPEG